MRKNWYRSVLGLILFMALALRLVALDRFPAGFTADEAAQGYTAYSILKTGRDEWGARWPINLRSFGDYKPPLQTYLMIPSIAVFGLNEWAVRLPNAILGALGILGVYFLAGALLANSFFPGRASAGKTLRVEDPKPEGLGNAEVRIKIPLLAALLLAISPWHISLSRGAFEANLTTFFMPLGFWLFLKGLKKPKYLVLASVFFGLNLFTYHAAKLVTPLLVVVLVIWGKEGLIRVIRDRRGRKEAVLAGVIFILFGLLTFCSTLTGGGTRAADIGIFSAGLEAPKIFLDNYFSYFSLRFLFSQGAGEATYGMIPDRSLLYLFELFFLIYVLYTLAKKGNHNFLPILAWIILGPVPAALSFGVGYHANRVAVMIPGIQILSAYGGISLWEKVKEGLEGGEGKKGKRRTVFLFFCFSVFLLSILSFLKAYFMDAPKVSAPAMSYGWKETVTYLQKKEPDYEKIIISLRFSEPQAFVAFYSKWDPKDMQRRTEDWLRYKERGFKFVDQLDSYKLGKYEFRNLDFSKDRSLRKTLLVGKPEEFPADASVQKMIVYPDGERAFWIVDTGKDRR